MNKILSRISLSTLLLAGAALPGCKMHPPEPESKTSKTEESTPAATSTSDKGDLSESASGNNATQTVSEHRDSSTDAAASSSSDFVPTRTRPRKVVAKPVAKARINPDDPLHGEFSLASALKGLKGTGAPRAEITTSLGKLVCDLYDDKAPITVANFIGLARGVRTWKNPDGQWVNTPAYDNTTFHRIIKGFMIQGGDAEGSGKGEAGYVIPDEVWEDAYHDQRGLLCMANRGANTNSAQFFILDAAAAHLDKGYTIFGKCGPDNVIEKIANVPVSGDRPDDSPKIKTIRIVRAPAAASAAKKANPSAPAQASVPAPVGPAPGAGPAAAPSAH